MGANFGIAGMDWQQRVNWDRLREYRIERARTMMKKHGLGALLCMYDENVRYITGTLTPGWNRLKPGLRYAMLCGDGRPILFEQGDIGIQIERHVPWLPKENIRHSFAWIKGAAGPASTQQVSKFTKAVLQAMKDHGVAGERLGVDFVDINMIDIFKEHKINWVDGMTPMMEARAVKSEDEQECFRIVGAIGDATHWECMKFLRPGVTENQVTAHLMEYLYNIPGMEDVEDVIVSSGPNTWPNWRNFSDRIIQPGDIVFMDLAALTWNGYKSCYYRTLLRREGADAGAEGHLPDGAYVALRLDRRGEGRCHHARHRAQVAFGDGDLGLRGRGSGGRQSVGPWTRARAIRPAGHLSHLVARPSDRDPGGHDIRARDAARQEVPLRRAH